MELKFENVEKAYSGKRGMCMCGCSGNWAYAGEADRSVKIILGKIRRADPKDLQMVENCVYLTTDTRTLAVYFKEPATQ